MQGAGAASVQVGKFPIELYIFCSPYKTKSNGFDFASLCSWAKFWTLDVKFWFNRHRASSLGPGANPRSF